MKKILTLFLLVSAVCLEPVHAQPNGFKMGPPSWMLVTKLSAGDAPYKTTRRNLEARFRQGRSPVTALATYLPNAKRGDVKSLFSAGVCAYENDKTSQQEVRLQRNQRMEEVLHLINDNPRWPTNYECIRLSFLLQMTLMDRLWLRHEILQVGQLLRKRHPNDLDVEEQYGWLLAVTDDLVSAEQAHSYLRRMIQKYPTQSFTFKSMLATSYQRKPTRQKDPTAVDRELALRREVLAADKRAPLTPRNKENIAIGELLIRLAERYKARSLAK